MASIPDWRHAKKALSQVRTVSGAYRTKMGGHTYFPRWRASAEMAHVAKIHRRAVRLHSFRSRHACHCAGDSCLSMPITMTVPAPLC
jgi:hypothetical protein